MFKWDINIVEKYVKSEMENLRMEQLKEIDQNVKTRSADELDPKWIRVSTILGMMPSLGKDNKWHYPFYQIDPLILQNAADRGTAVHNAILQHTHGNFTVLTDKESLFFDSYLKWSEEVVLRCCSAEQRLYCSAMNLTGCIDMIGQIGGSEISQIIDFKCTASPDHSKWSLQAAFYELLCRMNNQNVSKNVLFVQLDSAGEMPKIHEYKITTELTSAAISLYNIYTYLTKG